LDELRVTIASNIIDLRTKAGMTQLELAEKLNYSDKSVSKWERAEATPDVFVLKNIGEIFGVTVDYLLTSHDGWTPPPAKRSLPKYLTDTITSIVIVGIWTIALLLFIIFWLMGDMLWIVFIYAIPISLITLLVLSSIWEGGRYVYYMVIAVVFSIIATIYFTFYKHNWWQLFLLMIPTVIVVYLTSRLKRPKT
jgi:transcriptional regulator with XRE-family HTH domain